MRILPPGVVALSLKTLYAVGRNELVLTFGFLHTDAKFVRGVAAFFRVRGKI
jgi:hypothetical protein